MKDGLWFERPWTVYCLEGQNQIIMFETYIWNLFQSGSIFEKGMTIAVASWAALSGSRTDLNLGS